MRRAAQPPPTARILNGVEIADSELPPLDMKIILLLPHCFLKGKAPMMLPRPFGGQITEAEETSN
jgi:hypothetical protein